MKPTVGRIVHYYDADGGGPHAAIITLDSPTQGEQDAASLTIFWRQGGMLFMSPVPRSAKSKPGHWCWPPQIEELRKELEVVLGVIRQPVTGMTSEGQPITGPPPEPRAVPSQPITGPQCGEEKA